PDRPAPTKAIEEYRARQPPDEQEEREDESGEDDGVQDWNDDRVCVDGIEGLPLVLNDDGPGRAVDGRERQQENEKALSRLHTLRSRRAQQAGDASTMRTVAKKRGT